MLYDFVPLGQAVHDHSPRVFNQLCLVEVVFLVRLEVETVLCDALSQQIKLADAAFVRGVLGVVEAYVAVLFERHHQSARARALFVFTVKVEAFARNVVVDGVGLFVEEEVVTRALGDFFFAVLFEVFFKTGERGFFLSLDGDFALVAFAVVLGGDCRLALLLCLDHAFFADGGYALF